MTSSEYVVTYAKISMDKERGVLLESIYFGGICSSREEADKLATASVSSVKNGIVIPKIVETHSSSLIIDIMYDAGDKFEELIDDMNNAVTTMSRTKKKPISDE